MNLAAVAPFLAVSALVIMTPGPDTALTIRNVLLGGRRGGVFTALGVSTGQGLWALATAAGLAALLTASRPVFVAVKLVGAAYLVYLGATVLWSSMRRQVPEHAPTRASRAAGPLRPRSAFRQGVTSNLANPKMAVYFTAVLPQVVGVHGTFVTLAGFGLTFSLMTLLWLTVYSVAVSWAGAVLVRPRVRRALESTTGAVLIALGLRVAAEA